MKRILGLVFLLTILSGIASAQSRMVALSLGEAQRQIQIGSVASAEAARLGDITEIRGLVYDSETGDPILIGRVDQSSPPLDLDSLVVAMRAVLALKEWPLVSIDPAHGFSTTGKQKVRLEGGIVDSRFGLDFVAADARLKRLGLGLDHATGLQSYFELRRNLLSRGSERPEGRSRFWFYAVDPELEQRDGVFVIRSLKLGVRAQEVDFELGLTDQSKDPAAQTFAKQLSSSFDGLSREYPEIARLRGLYAMVAVARGLEITPDTSYEWWLKSYPVQNVPTPRQYDVVRREEQISTPAGARLFEVSGGIQFRALAVRLLDGDATALKEAVLLARPSRDSLSWHVPLDARLLEARAAAGSSDAPPTDGESNDAGATIQWKYTGSVTAPSVVKPGGVKADIKIDSADFQKPKKED
jgi:hypothetical protein